MAKHMLIDATHSEETRVVVVDGTRLEQFEFETSTKKQLKGNMYLAQVIRVEPSLQAAFVDYGGNRHGFLAFNDIHPDYYQEPIYTTAPHATPATNSADSPPSEQDGGGVNDENAEKETAAQHQDSPAPTRNYKIQDVVKSGQIMLTQVAKEERGAKGAALTTYLSLAGRYCVLFPNTAKKAGISRKITNADDRQRLQQAMQELDVPSQMTVILRTAGQSRSKAEIKRDYGYLSRTWAALREVALQASAASLVHEEGDLIKRTIRDIYSSDVESILVEGESGYRVAKDFMKTMVPSHARKVQLYRDKSMPLFHRYEVEKQLEDMHNPTVRLPSGGYIVVNQTEALVAVDVNSGRATREQHLEETALNTNLEAADTVARQLRLRDLAGLIVIDFIDMEGSKNNSAVERRLKEALKSDRARIQVGRISHFGLLEMSRQRLRPSLMEATFLPCPHCGGVGMVRSVENATVQTLRAIEAEAAAQRRSSELVASTSTDVALYILNNKRSPLSDIEARHNIKVSLRGDNAPFAPTWRFEWTGVTSEDVAKPEAEPQTTADDVTLAGSDKGATKEAGRKRRRRRRRSPRAEVANNTADLNVAVGSAAHLPQDKTRECETQSPEIAPAVASNNTEDATAPAHSPTRRRRTRTKPQVTGVAVDAVSKTVLADGEDGNSDQRKRRRPRRRKPAATTQTVGGESSSETTAATVEI